MTTITTKGNGSKKFLNQYISSTGGKTYYQRCEYLWLSHISYVCTHNTTSATYHLPKDKIARHVINAKNIQRYHTYHMHVGRHVCMWAQPAPPGVCWLSATPRCLWQTEDDNAILDLAHLKILFKNSERKYSLQEACILPSLQLAIAIHLCTMYTVHQNGWQLVGQHRRKASQFFLLFPKA